MAYIGSAWAQPHPMTLKILMFILKNFKFLLVPLENLYFIPIKILKIKYTIVFTNIP